MKNATQYEKKVRKLLSDLKSISPAEGPDGGPARTMVYSILEADASRKDARAALEALEKEFLDYNELRVAPAKDVVETLGRSFPGVRDKAFTVTQALDSIFNRRYEVDLSYMEKMTKRDLRRHLLEIGLSHYAAACLVLLSFGGHAIPVDQSLRDILDLDGYVEPGSEIADVQGFLERVIPQKNAAAAHEFFRQYVEKSAKVLAKLAAERVEAARVVAAAQPPAAKRRQAEIDEGDELAETDETGRAERVRASAARNARAAKAPKPAKPAKAAKPPKAKPARKPAKAKAPAKAKKTKKK